MRRKLFKKAWPETAWYLHSPGSASCQPRSQPCAGSPCSCAAAGLSLSPAVSDLTPGSSCCSPLNQSQETFVNIFQRADFMLLWFHYSLYEKQLHRIVLGNFYSHLKSLLICREQFQLNLTENKAFNLLNLVNLDPKNYKSCIYIFLVNSINVIGNFIRL